MNYHKQIFRAVDRINLLISIIEGSVSLQPPGAGININLLLSKQVYLAAFPLHDYDSLKVVVVIVVLVKVIISLLFYI